MLFCLDDTWSWPLEFGGCMLQFCRLLIWRGFCSVTLILTWNRNAHYVRVRPAHSAYQHTMPTGRQLSCVMQDDRTYIRPRRDTRSTCPLSCPLWKARLKRTVRWFIMRKTLYSHAFGSCACFEIDRKFIALTNVLCWWVKTNLVPNSLHIKPTLLHSCNPY